MSQSKNPEWKGKSRGGSLGHLFFILTLRYLGVRAAYTLLLLVVPYFVPFAPKATAAIWGYNRRIHGYGLFKSVAMIFVSYFRFGQTLIDKIAANSGLSSRYRFEFENYNDFISLLNSGKGLTIIGAHIGCWEMGSTFFDEYGKKMNIVMYDAEYQKIKEMVDRHSQGRNYKVIAVNDDPIANLIKIKAAIDQSEYVCFQGDRYLDEGSSFEASFMGSNARFPLGPFMVASRLRVPVVFFFAMRERGCKYRFYFRIVDASDAPRKLGVKPEMELFNRYKVVLEEMVGRYPQQWFNFYKFWN